MRDVTRVSSFLDQGRAELGWSRHTVDAYALDLNLYLCHLGDGGLASATTEAIADFIEGRRLAGDADRTLARRLAAVRSFHRYLLAEGFGDADLLSRLESIKREKRLPGYLTRDEIEALLAAPRGNGPLALRDRAVVELLYATGMRVSELCGLEVSKWRRSADDRGLGTIQVRGKGDKDRTIPLHALAEARLDDWLRRGRPRLLKPHSPTRLFLSARGRALTRDTVFRRLSALGRQAGLRRAVTPHLLRHTFATHLVHEGADLRAVQELLGHASLETTTIYTSVDAERLKKLHERCHPRG